MENEAGRRIFLNLFLSDVVVQFNGVLRIYPEQAEREMTVENQAKRRKLGGKADYIIGL